MARIIQGQDFRLWVSVKADITGQSSALIKYQKPGGTTGDFTATVFEENPGRIYYDVQDTENDESGEWTFWAYVTLSNGNILIGDSTTLTIYSEGA